MLFAGDGNLGGFDREVRAEDSACDPPAVAAVAEVAAAGGGPEERDVGVVDGHGDEGAEAVP
jgi:hypothetical protein